MTDWSRIVRQYGPIVWRTVYRLLSHEADAADCFLNTFVAALELSRNETVRNWPGLLKRLATTESLQCLRRRYRETARTTSQSIEETVDNLALESSQAARTNELTEHLRSALAELDSRQAEVFCLVCIEEWSYRQVAEHLDITINHIGVLLNRAKSFLRKRLKAHRPASAREPNDQEVSS